jgi:hypothetical protein
MGFGLTACMNEQGASFGRAATRRYQRRLLIDQLAAIGGLMNLLEVRRERLLSELDVLDSNVSGW